MKLGKIAKNTGMTLVLPVVVYLFFMVLCNVTGHSGFGVGNDLTTIIYNAVYAGLVAQAMAINVTTGRFDFAIGANLVLSTILGGNIALRLGWGPIGLLVFVVLIATVVGLISGTVYVTLKLPPMVVSVGLAMIYEAIAFMFNSAKGVKMIGNKMLVFARTGNSLILTVVVLALLVIAYDYTKIGYNRRALQGGQKIAVDVGIREKNNAVCCYVIAGVMMGLAGCVYLSKNGVLAPETGLGSSSYFMSAFLPMFIGGIFAKYSSYPIAIFMGAVVQATITSGLQRLGVSNSWQTVLNGLIVCAFLIYSSNSYKLVEAQMFREKLAKAKAARGKTAV
jgi:ribose transport system permease protein